MRGKALGWVVVAKANDVVVGYGIFACHDEAEAYAKEHSKYWQSYNLFFMYDKTARKATEDT